MSSQLKYPQADEELRDIVLREIDWEPAIVSKDISVKVKDGIVTLTGFVHNYLEKAAAERATKSVYGVRSIANDIAVKPMFARTDPEIARDVVNVLTMHAFVPDERIKTTVHDGFVTLEGTVEWNYQRSNAESAVRAVTGVRGIINDIQLKPTVSKTIVKERIEEALRRSAEVDARRITVTARDSKVELNGYVRSWLERDEAERAAWAAPGVSQVVDNLVVSP